MTQSRGMSLLSRTMAGVALGAGLIALSSCTISYDVEVLLRDGRVTFDLSHSRFIFGREDACIEELTVREVSDRQHIAWHLKAPDNECPGVRYLPYGASPADVKTMVAPTTLRTGQLYTVTLTALGGGGRKTFVILPKNQHVYGRIATIP